MHQRKTMGSLAMLMMVLIAGCGSNLSSYQPQSAAEEGIRQSLLEFEKAWKSNDTEAVLALIDEGALVMTGAKPNVTTVTKAQYADILPGEIQQDPSFKFGPPTIGLSGDNAHAVVKTVVYVRGKTFFYTINMAENNGRWLITKTHYTFED